MQDPRIVQSQEALSLKSWKKKPPSQDLLHEGNIEGLQEVLQSQVVKVGKKASKRSLKNNFSPLFHKPEKSTSESFAASSMPSNSYWALRQKYLQLEEESLAVGRELGEVEDELKALKYEKCALLDQLLVLEGLIDPSEINHSVDRKLI